MALKYHLYMDEADQFEQISSWNKGLIFGLLVPEEERERLAQEYQDLVRECGLNDFRLHGKDDWNQSGYAELQKHLIDRTLKSGMRTFVIRYEQDLLSGLPFPLSEEFAANRYMTMAQTVLEHVLFLCPELWDTDLVISFHPSSRVFVVPASDTDRLDRIREMGFYCLSQRKTVDGVEDIVFVPVWDEKGLRVYLHHLCLQYIPWKETTGLRSWDQIEMPSASPESKNPSDDPFVYWVDVLTGCCRWLDRQEDEVKDLVTKLEKSFLVDIPYGSEKLAYERLVHLYLSGNFHDFLTEAIQQISGFKGAYFRRQIEILMNRGLGRVHEIDESALFRLEAAADRYLRETRGNWDFVLHLVDRLFAAIEAMPEDRRNRPVIQRLLLKLHSHKLSGYNHRSEVLGAWKAFEAMKALKLGPRSLDDWREEIANVNRWAVMAANLFDFQNSNEQLSPVIKTLEAARALVEEKTGQHFADPLLGKLLGTSGQNLAFLAPRRPRLFREAEDTFKRSRNEFITSGDRVRQDINLVHLYLDQKAYYDSTKESWSNAAEAWNTTKEAWDGVVSSTGFDRFLDWPGPETARHKQFMLHILLKLTFSTITDLRKWKDCIETYRMEPLREWFGSAVYEHPFELICAYLGRMAIRLKMSDQVVEEYFDHAISIPIEGNRSLQPTLQMIRAQILTWWALEILDRDLPQARKKIQEAVKILKEIGNQKGLESILRLQDNHAVGGWFQEAWNSLNRVDWERKFDVQACNEFLSCFTFNYH